MSDERPTEEGAIRQMRDQDTEGHAADLPTEEGAVRQSRIEAEGAVRQSRLSEGDDDEAEGHMFLSDPNASREIARARSAEAERAARDRRLQKEARPNRQGG